MKKILCLALCALMLLAVVGCKKDASTGAQTEKTDGANAPDAGDELVFADGDQ